MPRRFRPYRAEDRLRVRALAVATAEGGRPSSFPDPELLADLLTDYYLEDEPGSTLVAEEEGRLLGYLTGCLDTRRYLRRMTLRVAPRAFARAFLRGSFFRPAVLRRLWRDAKGARRAGGYRRRALERYPAHLHVNVAEAGRRSGVGRELVERFCARAAAAKAAGVHLGVLADNAGARAFYERLGFGLLETVPLGSRDGRPRALCVYGKSFKA